MKVVLFCGGYGMRMRDGTSDTPKPMALVGSRPLLWHVMRYYAHFGHTEFILCLGYGAHHIKRYFLDYDETYSNDFVLSDGGRTIELAATDIADWRISFVDTGLESAIGERLRRVRHLLDGDEMFLANYADVLTDAPLDDMVARLRGSDAVASLLAVSPQSAFHTVEIGDDERVSAIRAVNTLPLWENGGYFVLRPRDLRRPRRGRRPRAGRLRRAGRARAAARLPLPRLLAAGRHRQGAGRAGAGLRDRPCAVDDLAVSLTLRPRSDGRPPVVTLLGAHCDDLEIGAGATLLTLAARYPGLVVDATVLSGTEDRVLETRAALPEFLPGASVTVTACGLPDGRLPAAWLAAKDAVEAARARVLALGDADLVLAPWPGDAHQDHRLLGELVTTAFRRHLVLHYEILKWDGDVGRPNVYVPVSDEIAERKWQLLDEHFVSQRGRSWFDREALTALLRVRGVECQERYAEAFHVPKAVVVP